MLAEANKASTTIIGCIDTLVKRLYLVENSVRKGLDT